MNFDEVVAQGLLVLQLLPTLAAYDTAADFSRMPVSLLQQLAVPASEVWVFVLLCMSAEVVSVGCGIGAELALERSVLSVNCLDMADHEVPLRSAICTGVALQGLVAMQPHVLVQAFLANGGVLAHCTSELLGAQVSFVDNHDVVVPILLSRGLKVLTLRTCKVLIRRIWQQLRTGFCLLIQHWSL